MDLSKQYTDSVSVPEDQLVKNSGKDVRPSSPRRPRTPRIRGWYQVVYSGCFIGALLTLIAYGFYALEKHFHEKDDGQKP
jgi:hypothetical protein